MQEIRFKKLHPDAVWPEYKTAGASGLDLACLERVIFQGLETKLIRTGIAVEIPYGYEGQIRLRSSVAKLGYFIPNAPGTIDSDYRGELLILLARYTLHPAEMPQADFRGIFLEGTRIAQIVFSPVTAGVSNMRGMPMTESHHPCVGYSEATELTETIRGAGGFGSTNGY